MSKINNYFLFSLRSAAVKLNVARQLESIGKLYLSLAMNSSFD